MRRAIYPATSNSIANEHTGVLKLRPAQPEDLALLQHWDEQPHVIDSDPNDDWEWETQLLRRPEWREQLIADIEPAEINVGRGRPIGFIQILDPALEETHYWGDVPQHLRSVDIWIGDAADLGKGYGTQMMRLAIDRCFQDATVTAIIIDPLESNTRAHRFYERFGFRFVKIQQFGKDICRVYQLNRVDWKPESQHGQ